MRRWQVEVATSVWDQIREQVRYIARHSVDNALAWEDRLDAALFGLAEVPGFAVDEDATDRLGYEVHRLVFERTYLVHYRLDDAAGVVTDINFRHGAREPGVGEP